MPPPDGPEKLAAEQHRREQTERELAADAPDERETQAHERRAEKAGYLKQKLDEQAEADR